MVDTCIRVAKIGYSSIAFVGSLAIRKPTNKHHAVVAHSAKVVRLVLVEQLA